MATTSTPRAELRFRHAVAALRRLGASTVVEIGPGTGQLLARIAATGTEVVGVEISDVARRYAKQALEGFPDAQVVGDVADLGSRRFDVLIALEVIEHIENDVDALREWRGLIRPGGVLLLSTPAHERRWTERDEAAGHYRRYEREHLREVLEMAGWVRPRIDAFGEGLRLMLGPLSLRNRHGLATDMTMCERTQSSSLNSITRQGRSAPLVGAASRMLANLAYVGEWPFRRTDLGDGYFVQAENPL